MRGLEPPLTPVTVLRLRRPFRYIRKSIVLRDAVDNKVAV
jgi:hypothetical protein